jgi:hypothetical protein
MINFRFHLVSITAVFLALAAGITIGAGVVDRATVDQIEGQLSSIKKNREETRAENARLSADLSHWGQFSEQAGDRLVAHHLDGMGVFVLAARGVDRSVADGLRGSLAAAGARVEGTLWFTSKWALAGQDDPRQLATQLELPVTTRPDDLRTAALARMASAWASGDSGPLVVGLVDTGFLDFEPGPSAAPATTTSIALAQLPLPSSLFVVLSGDSADVPSPTLALPLVDHLVEVNVPVLAAQPQRKTLTREEAAKLPPEFIPALLTEGQVASKVTTVDNVDDYRGRVAAVLALADLAAGRRGHYGFGDGTRVLPESAP